MPTDPSNTDPARRRNYNSPKRKQQSLETRQRIIEGGAALVHEFPEWNWKQLTYRAVSARSGVSERTIYRHFPSDVQLKNAVMQYLVRESGVDLDEFQLTDFSDAVAKMLRYLSSFAIQPAAMPDEPAFVSMDSQRRDVLERAVSRAAPHWSCEQVRSAAAALDVFWNPPALERLALIWELDPEEAAATAGWVIDLIVQAIRQGNCPVAPGGD